MNQYLISSVSIIMGVTLLYFFTNRFGLTSSQTQTLFYLLAGAYIFINILGLVSYTITNKEYVKKHNKSLPFSEFINSGTVGKDFFKKVMVGVGSGIVFGFLDNAGLFFGMDSLDPILPDGPLTKAGYGNVFSDTLSAFSGTFAGEIISKMTNVSGNTPIWANAVGTFIGCLTGLYTCKLITGRS